LIAPYKQSMNIVAPTIGGKHIPMYYHHRFSLANVNVMHGIVPHIQGSSMGSNKFIPLERLVISISFHLYVLIGG
jgi:hypothetical protein